MKCFKKVCIYIIVVLIILSSQFRIITFGSEELAPKSRYVDITPDNIENMDKFIKQQIDSGKIPGLSVGIVHDNKVLLEKGYGFKDLNQKRKAGNETLYSLGTGDEIFTALAVMDLQDKGMLDLRDTVLKYFPQLKMKYQGREVEVTIETAC
jgi:CubicO group peptidase (beta-lactamase class C family)